MKRIFHVCILAATLFAVGCWKREQQPLEPTVIEKVCTDAFGPFYDEKKHSRFHHVSFTGYLATPKSVMMSNTMFVDVYEKPNRGGVLVRSSFSIGSRKNQVARLERNYKESDLKIESNSGVMLGNGSKVLIEGDVSPGAVPGKWKDSCYVRVDKIEKAD
jgi:hypothetical protein